MAELYAQPGLSTTDTQKKTRPKHTQRLLEILAAPYQERLDQTAILWDYNYKLAHSLESRPMHLGMVSMGAVLGVDAWCVDGMPNDQLLELIAGKKVIIVNLFLAISLVQRLRKLCPDKVICVSPDFTIEQVDANHRELYWDQVLPEIRAADYILGRTHQNAVYYGAIADRPYHYFPIPVGPKSWFDQFQSTSKEDYFLMVGHSWEATYRQNLLVARDIQRETGLDCLYINARDGVEQEAIDLGLKATFHGYMDFVMVMFKTSRAHFVIDLYQSHTIGRVEVTSYYAGTPCIGSILTGASHPLKFSPLEIIRPVNCGVQLVANPNYATDVVREGQLTLGIEHNFDSVQQNFKRILEAIWPT